MREYWIVDLVAKAVELYQLRKRGLELVATFTGADEIQSSVLPDLALKARDVFEGVSDFEK